VNQEPRARVARERLLVERGLCVGRLLVGEVAGGERLVDRLDGHCLAGRTEPGVQLGRGDLQVARDGAGLADLVRDVEVVLDLCGQLVALVGGDVLVLDGRRDAVLRGLDDRRLEISTGCSEKALGEPWQRSNLFFGFGFAAPEDVFVPS
jgi:hypothetical protein